jgi:glycosyltransferase involved in cell wall biosynthesis
VAISSLVRERIDRIYGRESTVIFPPTDLRRFRPDPIAPGDHYLVLARLAPYKRIDLAVEAFNELGRRLIVVGDGRDRQRLEALAGPTVTFCGRLPQAEVDRLLYTCRALIWPGIEDFGLAPVEAMAAGRPVIARRAGGVLDTVLEGETGVFFDAAEPASLAQAVLRAEAIDWRTDRIRRHAQHFGLEPFAASLTALLSEALARGRERMS